MDTDLDNKTTKKSKGMTTTDHQAVVTTKVLGVGQRCDQRGSQGLLRYKFENNLFSNPDDGDVGAHAHFHSLQTVHLRITNNSGCVFQIFKVRNFKL